MITPDPVSAAGFSVIRQRFVDLGDQLTDAQLLELADAYHEMLRWRRTVRCRHPAICSASTRLAAEVGPVRADRKQAEALIAEACA